MILIETLMQTPWFDFSLSRAMVKGLVIGLVVGAFVRTILLHS